MYQKKKKKKNIYIIHVIVGIKQKKKKKKNMHKFQKSIELCCIGTDTLSEDEFPEKKKQKKNE